MILRARDGALLHLSTFQRHGSAIYLTLTPNLPIYPGEMFIVLCQVCRSQIQEVIHASDVSHR